MRTITITYLLGAWTDALVGYLPVIGILLIIASLVVGIRKRKQRRTTEPTAREQLERMNQQQGTRNDLQSLMVEIEQLAKRLSSQLDNKARYLETLMSEADQKIEQLERLQNQAATPPPSNGSAPAEVSRTDQRPPSSAGSAASAQPVHVSTDSPDRTDASATGSPDSDAMADQPPVRASTDALTRSVYDLADQGKKAGEIAGTLNEHIGKIELILALRER